MASWSPRVFVGCGSLQVLSRSPRKYGLPPLLALLCERHAKEFPRKDSKSSDQRAGRYKATCLTMVNAEIQRTRKRHILQSLLFHFVPWRHKHSQTHVPRNGGRSEAVQDRDERVQRYSPACGSEAFESIQERAYLSIGIPCAHGQLVPVGFSVCTRLSSTHNAHRKSDTDSRSSGVEENGYS